MVTEPTKVKGIGIISRRCEICYSNIMDTEPCYALLKDNSMHFTHVTCFQNNDEITILEKMNNMVQKTKNDNELFTTMEEAKNAEIANKKTA